MVRFVEMVTSGRRGPRYIYLDYVGVEMTSNTKHEFFDGKIYAMAGGTQDHAVLALHVMAELDRGLRAPCRAQGSDLRIYVEAAGMATFPDGSVICGALQHHGPSPKETALNPTVLLEVTSDSSEDYDTGLKLEAYQTIPTLRDYIIVSHRERRITIHHRTDDGHWTMHVAMAGGRIGVASVSVELDVDAIYRGSSIE